MVTAKKITVYIVKSMEGMIILITKDVKANKESITARIMATNKVTTSFRLLYSLYSFL